MNTTTTKGGTGMKIVQLTAENVKRLKAVEITPNGPVQIVAGRNAQGKSSVLDSIWMALEWKASSKATPRPIRDGEDKASVRLDMGDLIVTRTWANGGTKLTVEAADGAVYQRPQEMLDALVGSLSFDPLAFVQQDPRGQVATLLSLVSLPFDPAALDAQRQGLYDQRQAVGQEKARAKGALESMPTPPADLPASEVSTQAILSEYEAAQQAVQRIADAERDSMQLEIEAQQADERVADAQAALKGAQQRADDAAEAVQRSRESLASLPEPPDVEEIKARLAAAEDTNRAVRDARGYQEKKAELATVADRWADLTKQMDELDAKKAKGLAAAKFPIDGLSFGDTGVTYKGVPFCQASSGEQLKVSLALAMAMNPKLRVIRITDGSLLDSENMALIEKMATEADFQIWIERVDESGTAGVVIEDGQVKS